jgi:4-coumarate--CoA ligase
MSAPEPPADPAELPRDPCPPLGRSAAWRVLRDLLVHARGCYSDGAPARADLTPARRLDTSDLGVDSLSRLQLAQQAADLFDLRRGGQADLLLARRQVGAWLELAAAGWADGPETVAFQSSGSQDTPKRAPHAAWRLWAEAQLLARRLPGHRRVVSLVPAHHIYGFIFTVLLPRALNLPVKDLADAGPQALGPALEPGDLVIGVPVQWDYLASALSGTPDGVTAVSSTAPLASGTARSLVAEAGLSRVVEVFGSTETAGIGTRDDPDAPFDLLETWDLAADGAGELRLRRRDDGVELDPPDRLVAPSPGRFYPQGRRDDAVLIGGTTVACRAVAERLEARPGVAAARVRPAEGRLKALIVPEAGHDPETLCAEVRAWADAALPTAERPLRIAVAPRVPTDALGKEVDWEESGADGPSL